VKRLRPGEWLAGLSALALFGFLFLDWFGLPPLAVPSGYTAYSRMSAGSGWHVLGWAALACCLLAIVAALMLPIIAASYESPVLPVLGSIVATLLGLLAVFALLVQVIAQPGPDELVEVKSGWWLGLIAAFGITGGAWMALKDESTPRARQRPIEVRPAPPAGPPSPDVP
jgi:hypothetical protein